MSNRTAPASLLDLGRQLWQLLDATQKRECVAVILVSMAAACLTLVAVAGITPFFAVLADPTRSERSEALAWLQQALAAETAHGFLAWLGALFVALLALANLANLLALLAIGRFAQNVGACFHSLLFDEYLHRDLAFHATHNSAALATRVVQDVTRTVGGVIQSGLTLFAGAAGIALIAGAIVIVDPVVAVTAIALLGGSYALIHAVTRRRLVRNGTIVMEHWQQRAQVIAETFAGIKDVVLHRAQQEATRRVARHSAEIAVAQASTPAIAMAPKYLLECVTGAGLVAAALWAYGRGAEQWPAHVAFLGFAAYRMLPAVQQVFAAVARVHSERAGFDAIVADLHRARRRISSRLAPQLTELRGGPRRTLRLVAVSYRHSRERPGGITDVTLEIPAGVLVGFVGPNGAGKSTLAEIALGLRTPDAGHVEIDGLKLHAGNSDAWLDTVAYVPQQLAFVDGTLTQNIAFGAAPDDVDLERVRDAASRAQLDAVIAALPDGLATRVGESGVRFSGGQRQRLGIARALYRNPSLLVVDEATNALDALTETEILDLLAGLRGRCTVIVIAHRPSALRGCDLLVELAEGRLVGVRRTAEQAAQRECARR